MNIFRYNDFYMKIPEISKITDLMSHNISLAIGGLWGAAYSYILSNIISQNKSHKAYVFITPSIEDAQTAQKDLATFLNKDDNWLYYFPFSHAESLTSEPDILRERLKTLSVLSSQQKNIPLVIAPVQAMTQKVPDPRDLVSSFITFKKGDKLDIGKLSSSLVKHGFGRVDEVNMHGEFSVRGGIVDIFSLDNEPVRIELFSDKIESIRTFDWQDQVSAGTIKNVTLSLSKLSKGDAYLTDYLPKDSVIFYKDRVSIDKFLRPHDKALIRDLNSYSQVEFSDLPLESRKNHFNYQISSLERFGGGLSGIRDEIQSLTKKGLSVTVFCGQKSEIIRLKELLLADSKKRISNIHIKQGKVSAGFVFPEISAAFISYNELFGRSRQVREFRDIAQTDKQKKDSLDVFLELEKNDFVVHIKYGIGRYKGTEKLKKNGFTQEYIILEYHDKTKVYVPTHQADLVEKYIAGTDRPPKLNRLGTGTWEEKKEKVHQAVTKFASELLEIQAIRKTRRGIGFPQDTDWQKEFDASFPYEETPDQLSVDKIIKKDMEGSGPMDRLICGDVGYGKTELAMRASFKASESGYQVAVLVPTTVLAQQHFQTFSDRFADYPINIEMLSRFRTKVEQQKIIESVKKGSVDIIIGTHRLVQSDIAFKNLGLIIIDEEQRFGVEHKERLRKLKALTDVLTLTATPIPRTLHMSLLGIRDISTLATPPLDRRAVITNVIAFDESVIKMAIKRELHRQGQIYFVHNRVYDIEHIAERLKRILPNVRIAIAHGQLPKDELESTMKDFINAKYDILVCTNIIESGLDIPRVNTIFINNAGNFGLSDLHQLRGRVGRYKHQAYAYLITPSKAVSFDATKRLKAITEFNELGAGFKIALRDMEIRGVGNILGRQQHGHIISVGYDLYCKLLRQATKTLQNKSKGKEEIKIKEDTDIQIAIDAYLPLHYIPSERQRIKLYRKLSMVNTQTDTLDIRKELKDRFGKDIPKEAENLLDLSLIKIFMRKHSFDSVCQVGNKLVVTYSDSSKARKVVLRQPDIVRIVDDNTIHIIISKRLSAFPDKVVELLKRMLK